MTSSHLPPITFCCLPINVGYIGIALPKIIRFLQSIGTPVKFVEDN